jgi:hypothetical protein
MSNPSAKASGAADIYSGLVELGRKVPKPEDLYLTPIKFISCMREIAPKLQKSGAWWSLGGDAAENLLDVHVRPTEIVIFTDKEGLPKIFDSVSEYGPSPIALVERKLDREAEPDDKKYPVFVRSTVTEFMARGAKVVVHGEYQMKVGEWEWGDSFFFDPVFVNIAGVPMPLMPLRLNTEIYLMLGWGDRAQLISEATQRAHAFVNTFGGET